MHLLPLPGPSALGTMDESRFYPVLMRVHTFRQTRLLAVFRAKEFEFKISFVSASLYESNGTVF
jgi:hypothetical protein